MAENNAPNGNKLIPEWEVDEDDQVLGAGLLVLAILAGIFGWNAWRGGDSDAAVPTIPAVVEAASTQGDDDRGRASESSDERDSAANNGDSDGEGDSQDALDEMTTSTVATALDLAPQVQAAVAGFGIDSATDGDVTHLTGYVGNQDEYEAAEAAAAAVPGIISVRNDLEVLQPSVLDALRAVGVADPAPTVQGTVATAVGVVGTAADHDAALAAVAAIPGVTDVQDRLRILQPDVEQALTDAAITDASAEMAGTVATVRGVAPTTAARDAALAAAASVDGVTDVIDELVAPDPIAEALNGLVELAPIQFATGSPQILEASFATLDEAVAIIQGSDSSGRIEIRGHTDVRGPEAANLALSQARADSVRAYLVERGVAEDRLVSTGMGETTEFGEGDSPEALEANRRVLFVALDS